MPQRNAPKPTAAPSTCDAPKPFWISENNSVELYHGDSLAVLRGLAARSVQCCISSPPYWGLRSYLPGDHDDKGAELGSESRPDCLGWARGENCAERDWATGCHVCRMVLVFREVRRVMRDDAVMWLNYGDTYAAKTYTESRTKETVSDAVRGDDGVYARRVHRQSAGGEFRIETDIGRSNNITSDRPGVNVAFRSERYQCQGNHTGGSAGLPPGNLCGIPWRVALALQADGWVLRQDIIWAKPAPMPESVRNRCTKAHEYIFLFAKRKGYYYDAEAIKEKLAAEPHAPKNKKLDESRNDHDQMEKVWGANGARNKRSVWTVASAGYAQAHFATFPPKLIEPMILAGTSERGACAQCGAPWERIVDKTVDYGPGGREAAIRRGDGLKGLDTSDNRQGYPRGSLVTATTGWQPTCDCGCSAVVPCVILDPFMGSGTVADVAVRFGRRAIGIELSETYIRDHQIPRVIAALAGGKVDRTGTIQPGEGFDATEYAPKKVEW